MAQEKGRRLTTKSRNLIAFFALILSLGMMMSIMISYVDYLEDKKEYEQIVLKRDALLEEKAHLENEIEMLNDDDYVTRYARENYVFTRDGEEVIVLPGKSEE